MAHEAGVLSRMWARWYGKAVLILGALGVAIAVGLFFGGVAIGAHNVLNAKVPAGPQVEWMRVNSGTYTLQAGARFPVAALTPVAGVSAFRVEVATTNAPVAVYLVKSSDVDRLDTQPGLVTPLCIQGNLKRGTIDCRVRPDDGVQVVMLNDGRNPSDLLAAGVSAYLGAPGQLNNLRVANDVTVTTYAQICTANCGLDAVAQPR